MSPEKNVKNTQVCPTCGTRVSEDATRCLVCGSNLVRSEKTTVRTAQPVQGSRMPEITLSLPAAIGLLALFLAAGALVVYIAMRQMAVGSANEPTQTPTITLTTTPTLTATPPTPTITNTPEPSPTPLTYKVKIGDTCGGIAYAFKVSVQSIVVLNNLPADCSALYENQALQIPQPTSTPTPMPSATLNPTEAFVAACDKLEYTVQENDTLSKISASYQVPVQAIQRFNGLVNEVVRFGQKLTIPLCLRNATPGPTPTQTPPPPYPPANLLLPADGAAFGGGEEGIPLQWASVGALRQNEAYAVTIEDVTEGKGRKLVEYVNETRYLLQPTFRAADSSPHVYRWSVLTVRQVGTDNDGNPLWTTAGAVSPPRVFTWLGGPASAAPGATPTP